MMTLLKFVPTPTRRDARLRSFIVLLLLSAAAPGCGGKPKPRPAVTIEFNLYRVGSPPKTGRSLVGSFQVSASMTSYKLEPARSDARVWRYRIAPTLLADQIEPFDPIAASTIRAERIDVMLDDGARMVNGEYSRVYVVSPERKFTMIRPRLGEEGMFASDKSKEVPLAPSLLLKLTSEDTEPERQKNALLRIASRAKQKEERARQRADRSIATAEKNRLETEEREKSRAEVQRKLAGRVRAGEVSSHYRGLPQGAKSPAGRIDTASFRALPCGLFGDKNRAYFSSGELLFPREVIDPATFEAGPNCENPKDANFRYVEDTQGTGHGVSSNWIPTALSGGGTTLGRGYSRVGDRIFFHLIPLVADAKSFRVVRGQGGYPMGCDDDLLFSGSEKYKSDPTKMRPRSRKRLLKDCSHLLGAERKDAR